ncbi:MAG: class I SAM-dependent methyltransferase, partial [Proteobacteria bacterium]|nr:class I SAM-dependent methyltransferase [Pseudomonadota bacterium]
MKKTSWRDAANKNDLVHEHQDRQKTAYFGYQRIPEAEKAGWVLRHFNTVAPKYDLMNTLLSFGIHHL